MSVKVKKVSLDLFEPQALLNEGAEILSGRYEQGQPVLFALVDETKPQKLYSFKVLPTNTPEASLEGCRYLVTFYSSAGFAWHVFQLEDRQKCTCKCCSNKLPATVDVRT